MSEDPSRLGLFTDTCKHPSSVYCACFSVKPGILSLLVGNFQHFQSTLLNSLINIQVLFRQYISSSPRLHLFVLGAYLSSSYTLHRPPLGRAYLSFGLMYSFLDFEELPLMTPVSIIGDSITLYLAGAGGDSGMEGGGAFTTQRI